VTLIVPVAPDRIRGIYEILPFGRFLALALLSLGASRGHVSFLRFGTRPYSSGVHRPCFARTITLTPPSLISVSETSFLMSRRITSFQRRHLFANRILFIRLAVIRPYSHYVSFGLLCMMSDDSEYYAEYIRTYR
jgi:hypothetical protein